MKEDNIVSKYSEIESLIVSWNNDGTKTAGSLTRCIISLLTEKPLQDKNDGLFEKNLGFYIEVKFPFDPDKDSEKKVNFLQELSNLLKKYGE